jgi:preprotein translocase subunit SecG
LSKQQRERYNHELAGSPLRFAPGVARQKKEKDLNPLLVIVIIALVASGIGLIVFIMLHSGKGTGVSDAIASSLYSSQSGTSIIEKNLDRITIIFAIVFLVSLLILMIIYPQGSIA